MKSVKNMSLIFVLYLIIIPVKFLFAEITTNSSEQFSLLPMDVGQYVIYRIKSTDHSSEHNRYEFLITDKEMVDGFEYFG